MASESGTLICVRKRWWERRDAFCRPLSIWRPTRRRTGKRGKPGTCHTWGSDNEASQEGGLIAHIKTAGDWKWNALSKHHRDYWWSAQENTSEIEGLEDSEGWVFDTKSSLWAVSSVDVCKTEWKLWAAKVWRILLSTRYKKVEL